MPQLLDADAAADKFARENSGFSVDASVRTTLIDLDVPSYFQSLEHVLKYCTRLRFALERLSVIRDADGRISRVRTALAVGNVGKQRDAANSGHDAEDCCGARAKPRSHDTSRTSLGETANSPWKNFRRTFSTG